jgi:hypothetical protein
LADLPALSAFGGKPDIRIVEWKSRDCHSRNARQRKSTLARRRRLARHFPGRRSSSRRDAEMIRNPLLAVMAVRAKLDFTREINSIGSSR